MKKTKHLLIALVLVIVTALTVSLLSACSSCKKKPSTTEALQSIELDTASVKKDYVVGDTFTSEGLKVYANILVTAADGTETTDKREVTSSATVDSSKYNAEVAGEYNIDISYTLGSVTKSQKYKVTVAPEYTITYTVEVDTTNVKTYFIIGEAFTSEGLKVYANITKTYGNGTTENEKSDVTADAIVSSVRYSANFAGEYTIEVSYRLGSEIEKTSYTVTVNEMRYGVDVILLDGAISGVTLNEDKTSGEFELDSEHTTVTIDTSKIEVRIPNEKGVVDYESEALAANEYSLKVFKNATEEVNELTGLGAGAYEIWVYLPEEEGTNYVRKNFVQLMVVDNPISLTFNSNAGGTVTSQSVSNTDSMSATWKFTATYASGATVPLTAEDVKITLDTKTAGENKQAEVSYTVKNAVEKEVTVTTTVPYTITAAAGAKIDQSFVVVNKDDAATALATVEAGGTVEDNSLFKITTAGALEYATVTNDKRITSATLLDGSTVDFNQALKQSDATAPDGTTKAPAIEFEAKADITLKVYVVLCNNSYNSDRKGTFDITIYNAGGSVKSTDTSKTQGGRTALTSLSFDLAEGEKVSVSATYTDAKEGNTFKMWLFGAEASGLSGGGSSEKLSESMVVVNKEDAATALATVEAGGTVEDNSLFKITTAGALEYATVTNDKRITSATLLDGSTVDFNQALKQSDATAPDGTTKAPAIEFEAKADITLKVYVVLCNNSYNSDRKGTFDITIYNAGGSVKSTDTSKTQGGRTALTSLSFDLAEGEKVSVSATYTDAKEGNTFKMWFFGAEAETK